MNAFKTEKLNIKSIVLCAVCVILCITACVILFCQNMTHAVALEQELRCGIPEHTHVDACYDGDFLVCEETAHAHDGNCYIVLLKENDINAILTLLTDSEEHSLEHVISDTMSSALNFNANLNSVGSGGAMELSQDTVAQFNTTISDEEDLPNIVLNENLNTPMTLALNNTGNDQGNTGTSTYAMNSTPSTGNYKANFYVYLDNTWTCIGTLDVKEVRITSSRSYSTVQTADLLNLVNSTLGTEYVYNSFDIAVSTSENSGYAIGNNVGIASVTTTIAYRLSSSEIRKTRYVRLIPEGGKASSTDFNFYTVKLNYPEGYSDTKYVRSGTTITLPAGNYEWNDGTNTYASGQAVTITKATTFEAISSAPPTYVNVNYNVNFPSVGGVTVSAKPTMAGLATTTVRDEFTEGSEMTVRNVSQQSVQGTVNGNGTGLTRVIQFRGWKVGNTDTIVQPNTKLIWEELVQYANGTALNLTAVWDYNALQTVSFFIRFDSVAVDTNGNVTNQDSNLYTQQMYAAYLGGADPSIGVGNLQNKHGIADTTADNSYGADQKIRALYGERTDGVWLSSFPSDDYIFESLVQYANTGYLSVDGVPVKAEDLNSREYAIRWYVFKCQDDAWHVDGKLVKKVGLIHVYKIFAGNKELIAEAKTDFYIDATDVSTGENTVLDLNNYTSYDSVNDKYMWELSDVEYGEYWEITEHPHQFDDDDLVNFSVYSEYTVMDAHGSQSITGTGTSLTVSGMTYALDEGVDEVLRAEFTNIYNRSDSIIIKKQDSLTGVSIGGAVFRLYQNNKALTFRYNADSDRYEYDPDNGTVVDLQGNVQGYYEIFIEDFSYDLGPIVVREITAPKGYTPIGDIEIGYTDDGSTVGILSGNSELIRYIGGVLVVGNSTDSSSVTVVKDWECDPIEWRDVTVQLLANGKLVTTVIAGVEPTAILNDSNGWTHTWDNLPVYVNGDKIEWSVRETAVGTEMAKADGSFVNWLVSYGLPVVTTDENGEENTRLTVTNTTKRVMLRLTKTDLSKTTQLKGATFLLEAVDAGSNVLANEVAKTATTGDAGTLIFDNLKCGIRYRLTETAPPVGYQELKEYIYFTINEDGSVSVEESFYAEAGATAYNLIVKNGIIVDLPESGGAGIGIFYALGLLLMTATLGIYIGYLRKRRYSD